MSQLETKGMQEKLLIIVREARDSGIMLNEMHTELDRTWITDTLRVHRCNQVRTARAIGVHRNTLSRKLESLNINPKEMRPSGLKKPPRAALAAQEINTQHG